LRAETIDLKSKNEVLEDQGRSILATVSRELAQMEKRDWELWTIVLGTGIVVSAGLLALISPSAFMKQGDVLFELRVPREMFLGLVVLLVLFNTYMVSRRLELRRVRQRLISSTIQGELARLQSLTDPLTQVYNRRSLDEMVGRYSSHARRLRTPLTLVLIDVDHFKDVNTRFGHLIGDFVIAETASLLKACVRGSDAVIRYGGDEFILILADTSREGAMKVTERIAKSFEEWNRIRHLDGFDLSCSAGISEWKEGRTLEEILNEADREMYSTKSAGAPLL
jgi:diguanylate cyclase (GGDEF)-like protein